MSNSKDQREGMKEARQQEAELSDNELADVAGGNWLGDIWESFKERTGIQDPDDTIDNIGKNPAPRPD